MFATARKVREMCPFLRAKQAKKTLKRISTKYLPKKNKTMNQANNVFLITLAVTATGYSIKKMGFFTEKEGKIISKLLMHTTFPALMLVSTIKIKLEPQLFLIPLTTIIYGSILLAIAWFVFKKYPNNLRGLLTMGSGGFNTGLFAFPIIESIWGRDALVYAIMFDIGNTFIVFGLIYSIGNYFSEKENKASGLKAVLNKVARLMPLQFLILGLIINALSIPVAPILLDFLDVLAKGNKPLVLLLMGIYLSFEVDKKQVFLVFKSLSIRYLMGAIAVAFLCILLPHSVMRSILIVCVVLPVGLTILPFSDELNYDSRIAGLFVNLSLLISFSLMWALVLGLNLTVF
jgi:malate permease and related proteins